MSLRPRWLEGVLSYFESATDETVHTFAPVTFYDDFLGSALDTAYRWTVRDTAGGVQTMAADAAGGEVDLALSGVNEVQLIGIDWGDQRTLCLNRDPVFEARVRFPVLPTGAVVACIGLCGDHNAAVNTVAESMWFRLDGSGAITVETDDTIHEQSLVATGVTLVADQFAVLRIECDDYESIRFYIDGTRVATGTTFVMHTVPALALQPVVRIGKEAAAASVGTLRADYVKTWQKRTA